MYGSVLGALGLAVAGTYLVHSLDIHSGEDFRQRVQSGFGPLSGAIQGWMVPVKERAQVRARKCSTWAGAQGWEVGVSGSFVGPPEHACIAAGAEGHALLCVTSPPLAGKTLVILPDAPCSYDFLQAWLGGAARAAAAQDSGPSELQRRLASRYNPRRAEEGQDAGAAASAAAPAAED